MEAVERFDESRGIQFSTFADYRIRGAMIDAIRSSDHMSRHRREQERDLELVKAELSKVLGRTPDRENSPKKWTSRSKNCTAFNPM